MSHLSQVEIEKALATIIDPYLQQNLVDSKVIKNIHMTDTKLGLEIQLAFPALRYKTRLIHLIQAGLREILDREIQIDVTWKVQSHVVQQGVKTLPQVKNIIAVASGKGGVGKSTTAVNLALALKAEGGKVGLLDADIYGPSQPLMLGIMERPKELGQKPLSPVIGHGLQTMSIGYLINPDTPMVWRGPMVSTALQQLLYDTAWGDLDYLIIDLPPGTGDVQLTLAQKIPVSAAVIVTTPQDLALLDARKAYAMFTKVHVPVLGVIENMSTHICRQCGYEEAIFGHGGGQRLAEQYHLPLLGALPLALHIREQTDSGTPTVVAEPESAAAKTYHDIALRIAAKLSLQAKDYSRKFPTIVVKED